VTATAILTAPAAIATAAKLTRITTVCGIGVSRSEIPYGSVLIVVIVPIVMSRSDRDGVVRYARIRHGR
jgi:hypothetical protein